ncbi:MAG: DUF5110 domain-containing protein [Chloroflexales bacterium]|nr:DUF5110 domain-containing protein [Chloroflexales bacterium]
MSLNDFLARVAMRGEPLPDPAAVTVHGECRVTVLAPRLLRLEWAPGAAHDDRPTYAFPRRLGPRPPFHLSVDRQSLAIDTGALRLTREGLAGPFTAENTRIDLEVAGATVSWRPGAPDPLNLRGARRTLDGCRGEAALDPGILSRSGWAFHDDSDAVRFDPDTGWVQPRPADPLQDWYFFGYGHDYTAALADYARFGGSSPLIPRWALGTWWSRYWAYSEQDLRGLVAEFAAQGFPLDTLVIDMDWHTPHGWTGYTWNRDLFPDPSAFLGWLRDQGLHTTLNLHPAQGVQPHEEAHPAFVAALGADPALGVLFCISDAAFARSYFELLHHPLEDQGVDFWWMDWQQGRSCELPGLDPLPWLNHLHYHDLRRRPGLRPMIFSRWGGLGNHRYPIGFSGDTYATWEALRFQPYFTATAANVLYGWWSHDIGGHFGVCEPELFARWVQLGALGPVLRLHATKDPAAERRPWAFPPAVRDVARDAFTARYELLPYLYTLARVHHDQALAPCRPLYYGWPDAEAAYTAREQYQLGDQLIVAPIIQPAAQPSGLASADVWVPPGEWVERTTGELLRGPAWARLVGDLSALPQLVRAGGILPLAPATPRSHQQPTDQLTLAVFPGPRGDFRLYEDDGVSELYLDGQSEWTPITLLTSPDGLRAELVIGPSEGRCDALPVERAYTVRLEFTRRPLAVRLDAAEHNEWDYDEAGRRLSITIPARPKRAPVTLAVEAAKPLGLLGEDSNIRLRSADARRLLGLPQTSPLGQDWWRELGENPALWYGSAERAELLEAALSGATDAHRSALARLGGPFVHVYEHTTPEDASRSLGTLVIAAPGDDTPVGVAGIWRIVGPEGHSERPFDLGELRADAIIAAPFAWGHDVATRRWSLDLRLGWRGRELAYTFTAQTLFPTIGAWRTMATTASQAYPVEQILDDAGAPRDDRPWAIATHTPAHSEFQNLTERYNVPLSHYAYASRGADMIGYAAAALTSPDARSIRVAYQSPRPARVYLNGVELVTESFADSQALRLNRDWSRTAPAHLRRGANHLLIVTDYLGADAPWRWFLHAMVLGSDGLPAPDLAIGMPGAMLE